MFQLDPKLQEDTILMASLPLCEMLLMDDRQYPWLVLVPRRPNLRELVELNSSDVLQLQTESNAVSKLLLKAFHAEKLNVASLGNVVAQLHVHHIARFIDDIAWPKPVWGVSPAKPYDADEVESIARLIADYFILPRNQHIVWRY